MAVAQFEILASLSLLLRAIRLMLELTSGAGQDQLSSPAVGGRRVQLPAFAVVLCVMSVAILIGVSLVTGDPLHDKVAVCAPPLLVWIVFA